MTTLSGGRVLVACCSSAKAGPRPGWMAWRSLLVVAPTHSMWRGLEVWSRLISSWRWLTTHLLKLLRTTQSALSRAPRQNIERLLADVADGQVDVVLAFANDRLYRRVEDQLRLMRALDAVSGRIVTVNDSESDPTNAGGQLTVGVLADVGA
jgi:Resolvase, N terminal domain